MLCRYKKTHAEFHSGQFNMSALSEILAPDDSVFIHEADVFLSATGEWKDLHQAFVDHDVIVDNYNTCFFEPKNEADRKRGYT